MGSQRVRHNWAISLSLSPCARGWKVFLHKDWAVPDKVIMFNSVQFGCSVTSNSLWPHGLQHARPPCPLPTPRVYSNSSLLSQWCHPIISSSVVPFFSCLQSFAASGSSSRSQFFTSGGQSIGASASVLPIHIQDWSPFTPRNSQESSPISQFKSIRSLVLRFPYSPTLTSIHDHRKNHSLD